FLTGDEAVLSVEASSLRAVHLKLIGAQSSSGEGLEELPGASHYLTRKDPSSWVGRVPHYARVHYPNVYSGVDLIYYGNHQHVEHDFVVKPGADPNQIRFEVTGADNVELDSQGELVMNVSGAQVLLRRPTIYQGEGTARIEIPGGYALSGDRISFE